MSESTSRRRLALKCDPAGRVLDVIRDDLGVTEGVGDEILLPMLGTPEGSARCFEMLSVLREESALFGWLIEMRQDGGAVGLHFAGVQRNDELLLVASEDLADVTTFTDELQRINNDHVTRLRALVKERHQAKDAEAAFERMSALNNADTALEREILHKNKELERLMRAKNELLGMAAHDLRNPLTVIGGYLEMLRVEKAVDEEHESLLEEIETAVSMMCRILDGVLDVSAIESGVLKLDRTVCDLEAIVGRAVSLRTLEGRHAGVALALESSGPIRVSADEVKLHQVLNNLLANAIEHAPRESTVTVRVGRRGTVAVVSVADQGPGVPDEARSRVFKAFHKGSEDKQQGTGLGLAISRRIAHGHDGSLELMPDEGQGARFEFCLPLLAEATD